MTDPAAPLHSIAEFRTAYEDGTRLRGFRSGCGFVTATWGLACPRCGRRDLEETELGGRGKIAAYSVQNVPSDEFLNDAPYAYVVVDLDSGGRISGWIDGVRNDDELEVGEAVVWVPSYKPGIHFRALEIPGDEASSPPVRT
ncbi:MAG TPA: OB-fold domain-containing protein [Thermoplasmata archaeon]